MPKRGGSRNAKKFGPNPKPPMQHKGPARPATMQGGSRKRGR